MAQFRTEPVIRKSLRRSDHEYDRSNVYFITIRTFESARLLGEITEDGLHVFESGMMVRQEWMAVSHRFAGVEPGLLVVMPDHVHGVLVIDAKDGQRQALRPTLNSDDVSGNHDTPGGSANISLPRVIQAFKSLTTRQYMAGVRELGWPEFNGKLWQRNYYERIVRSQTELDAIVEYIRQNPQRLWESVYVSSKGDHCLE